MKKIKEGLINEEIVRRYSGSDNEGNSIVGIQYLLLLLNLLNLTARGND